MRVESIPVDLIPKCEVCTGEIPLQRARNSFHSTCSAKCAKVLKAWRKHQDWLRMCPSCLHPSTPEQRAEYKAWRVSRGDRGAIPVGRPATKSVDVFKTVLGEAREWLDELRSDEFNSESLATGEIPDEEAAGRIRELDSLLAKISKLLDNPKGK